MKIKRLTSFVLCTVIGLALSGCSQSIDSPDNDDQKQDTDTVTYTLSSDKTEANVGERITFTVMSSTGEDVTEDWSMCDETFCFTNNWVAYNEPGTHTVSAHLRADDNISAQNTLTLTITGTASEDKDPKLPDSINPEATYVLYCDHGDQVFLYDVVRFYVKEVVNGEVVNDSVQGFKVGFVGDSKKSRFLVGSQYVFNEAGTYELDAILYYQDYRTGKDVEFPIDKITITAKEKEIIGQTDNFYQRVLYVKWTGTWCGNCPRLEYAINNIVNEYTDDRVVPLALHSPDRDACKVGKQAANIYNSTYRDFGLSGIPAGVMSFDSKMCFTSPSESKVFSDVINTLSGDPAIVPGLAIETSLNGRQLTGTVKTTAHETGEYLIGVLFVESGVETYQNGVEGSRMMQNHVVHFSLTEGKGSLGLHDCGTLTNGQEYVLPISLDIPVHSEPADFVFDNCELVYMVYKKDSSVAPYGYYCANVASVKIGQSKDYEYEPIYAE